MNRVFFLIKGNNGATYFINTKNWVTIQYSLGFYKAISFESRILKFCLQCYSYVKGFLLSYKLKSIKETNHYLQQVSKTNKNFNLDDKCSVFIAPTRDKIIVHHHEAYFQKFAFGESYVKVKDEAFIYSLFHDKIEHFQVSDFYDYNNDPVNKFCSFKLSNLKVIAKNNKPLNLVLPLIEFFNLTQSKTITVNEYLSALLIQLNDESSIYFKPAIDDLNQLKNKYAQINIPLGLVHRDFKPWNIIHLTKPLIFDFEETIMDGPPMEDLFNFIIDPEIMYKSIKEICNYIFNKQNTELYELYLSKLNLEADFELFLKMYLINKILFLEVDNKHSTSNKYKQLLLHIITG